MATPTTGLAPLQWDKENQTYTNFGEEHASFINRQLDDKPNEIVFHTINSNGESSQKKFEIKQESSNAISARLLVQKGGSARRYESQAKALEVAYHQYQLKTVRTEKKAKGPEPIQLHHLSQKEVLALKSIKGSSKPTVALKTVSKPDVVYDRSISSLKKWVDNTEFTLNTLILIDANLVLSLNKSKRNKLFATIAIKQLRTANIKVVFVHHGKKTELEGMIAEREGQANYLKTSEADYSDLASSTEDLLSYSVTRTAKLDERHTTDKLEDRQPAYKTGAPHDILPIQHTHVFVRNIRDGDTVFSALKEKVLLSQQYYLYNHE
ncbi:MAG: hypothetical protein ACPGUD_01220 [Parashewanella sp.]